VPILLQSSPPRCAAQPRVSAPQNSGADSTTATLADGPGSRPVSGHGHSISLTPEVSFTHEKMLILRSMYIDSISGKSGSALSATAPRRCGLPDNASDASGSVCGPRRRRRISPANRAISREPLLNSVHGEITATTKLYSSRHTATLIAPPFPVASRTWAPVRLRRSAAGAANWRPR
jgi:hypothetical protein